MAELRSNEHGPVDAREWFTAGCWIGAPIGDGGDAEPITECASEWQAECIIGDHNALVAEVTRLRTENAELRDEMTRRSEQCRERLDDLGSLVTTLTEEGDEFEAERDAARVEVSQLRAKIEDALAKHDHTSPYTYWCRSLILRGGTCNCWRAALAEPLGSTPTVTQHEPHCYSGYPHFGGCDCEPLGSPEQPAGEAKSMCVTCGNYHPTANHGQCAANVAAGLHADGLNPNAPEGDN